MDFARFTGQEGEKVIIVEDRQNTLARRLVPKGEFDGQGGRCGGIIEIPLNNCFIVVFVNMKGSRQFHLGKGVEFLQLFRGPGMPVKILR